VEAGAQISKESVHPALHCAKRREAASETEGVESAKHEA
jgi:hypothetical protein